MHIDITSIYTLSPPLLKRHNHVKDKIMPVLPGETEKDTQSLSLTLPDIVAVRSGVRIGLLAQVSCYMRWHMRCSSRHGSNRYRNSSTMQGLIMYASVDETK